MRRKGVMVVREPRLTGGAVSATVSIPTGDREIVYSASRGPMSDSADAFFAATLIPAMRFGLDLRFETPVSHELLAAAPHVQNLLHGWNRRFRRIELEAEPRPAARGDPERVTACFFSCGVDSFFSALRHLDDIDALVFARGFDPLIAGTARDDELNQHVRSAAAELGKPLVEIDTNIRTVWDRELSWEYFHGAALASIGLALAPRFSGIFVPPSHQIARLVPWGAHPDLVRLWSTAELELIDVDADLARSERVAAIAEHDVALRHLQVCWERRNGEYNCCRCEKCLRTMVTLHVLGKLAETPAFPLPLEREAVASLTLYAGHVRRLNVDNLRLLEARGQDEPLQEAIRQALRRPLAGRVRRAIAKRRHAAPLG